MHTAGAPVGQTSNRYIGLSFESGTLDSGKFDNVGDLAQLLRNLGRSVMRFGGNTVDTSFSGITKGALAGLVRLAKASGWTVLYSENLGHFNAAVVTRDARAVSAALGRRLSALACGNEPDLFPNYGLRPPSYSESEYQAQESRCLTALRAGARKAPIEGPDTANDIWLPDYAATEAGRLSSLGQHYYPMGCGLGGRTPAAFAATMLSAGAGRPGGRVLHRRRNGGRDGARGAADQRDQHRLQRRRPGGEQLLRVRPLGGRLSAHRRRARRKRVQLPRRAQLRLLGLYAAVRALDNEYAAQPIYYGMLFTHLLGSGKLLPVTVATRNAGDHATAFALRPSAGGGLRLIVENLTAAPADVTLRVGGHQKSAEVWTLTGPSLLATSGVEIQGGQVAGNGTFTLHRPRTIGCSAGSCQLALAPYSAALVRLG